MVRSFFGRRFAIVGATGLGQDRKARPRGLQPSVDGLEHRNLLSAVPTGGSVTLSASLVTVTPDASASQNTVVVQYQNVSGKTMLDVQLNGVDHDFALGQISAVYLDGQGSASNLSFTNKTSVEGIAAGGSGSNVFTGGSGVDIFAGGSGTNTFNAGTGFDILEGGTGSNTFNESATGSGIIVKDAGSDTVNAAPGAHGTYYVY